MTFGDFGRNPLKLILYIYIDFCKQFYSIYLRMNINFFMRLFTYQNKCVADIYIRSVLFFIFNHHVLFVLLCNPSFKLFT